MLNTGEYHGQNKLPMKVIQSLSDNVLGVLYLIKNNSSLLVTLVFSCLFALKLNLEQSTVYSVHTVYTQCTFYIHFHIILHNSVNIKLCMWSILDCIGVANFCNGFYFIDIYLIGLQTPIICFKIFPF